MNSDHDPLKELWQQQTTDVPDESILKKQWSAVKQKQWLYLVMDMIGVLVGPVMLILFYTQMHWFEYLWFVIIVTAATFFTVYIVWLRRHSLWAQSEATSDYLELLIIQYGQNIKIARAKKYSVLVMPVLFAVLFIGAFRLQIYEPERLIRKLLVASGILVFLLPDMWIWADKRAKRYTHEKEALQRFLLSGNTIIG